ncbi:hypothetical protein D3C78_1494070 [compost metagenome]
MNARVEANSRINTRRATGNSRRPYLLGVTATPDTQLASGIPDFLCHPLGILKDVGGGIMNALSKA